MKKTVTYFPHDCNARNDERILELRAMYGPAGYAHWFMICELMAETESGSLRLERLGGYSLSLSMPQAELQAFLDVCQSLGLLYLDEAGELTNKRMQEHKSARARMAEAGRKPKGKASSPAVKKTADPERPAAVGSVLEETRQQLRDVRFARTQLAVSFDMQPRQELEAKSSTILEVIQMQNINQLSAVGASWEEVIRKWNDTIMAGETQYSLEQGERLKQYEASLRKYVQSWIRNGIKATAPAVERRDLRA